MNSKPTTRDLFRKANSEWENGKERNAFTLFLKAAQLGEASAQHNVGYFYDEGIGTRRDKRKALSWYKKAWSADHQTGTCMNIARLYESAGNWRAAMSWWRKGIEKGDGDCALDLAKHCLKKGSRGQQTRALRLLKIATKSGRITELGREEALELLKTSSSTKRAP